MPTHCNYVHTSQSTCQGQDAAGAARFGEGNRWKRRKAPRGFLRPAEACRANRFRYCLRIAFAVASSVIKPLIRRPFSAALIAETLAGPTAAPMVRASAGI
jgi:hypothetical protein